MGDIKREKEGAKSIYGGEFADESFHVKHTEVGLLGMCKRSGLKHTNECQFYVTLGAPLNFLDNESVVFGRVISGFECLENFGKQASFEECLLDEQGQPINVEIASAGKYSY